MGWQKRENLNRKPWIFPLKDKEIFLYNFSLKPINCILIIKLIVSGSYDQSWMTQIRPCPKKDTQEFSDVAVSQFEGFWSP